MMALRPYAQRYADPLADISIVEQIAPDPERYTGRYAKRYTGSAAPRYGRRYAGSALKANRYSSRYAGQPPRVPVPAGTSRINRILVAIPPPSGSHTGEELLWIPAWEFERCFEEWDPTELWMPGAVVNFTDAVECMRYMGYDEDDVIDICTLNIEQEKDSFEADGWCDDMLALPFTEALALRAELACRPTRSTQVLEIGDLLRLREVLGAQEIPTVAEAADAISLNPYAGLGGAALDHLIWRMPGLFGAPGARLEAAIAEVEKEVGYLLLGPVDNFLLYSGSLHPGTTPKASFGDGTRRLYPMTDCYVVSRISYHSDLTGTVAGGWRSCWLEPTATPAPWKRP